MQSINTTTTTSYTVKVRRDQEVRRFGFSGASYAALAGLVRQLFALPEKTPLSLKWKDEEGDMVTLGSDQELAEALKSHESQVLNLVLSGPGKKIPAPAAANVAVPVASSIERVVAPAAAAAAAPAVTLAPVATPVPAPAPAPECSRIVPAVVPAPCPAPKQVPAWKQEKMKLVTQWKEERQKLREQIRAVKTDSSTDKKALQEKVKALRTQVQETKKELQRMPRDNVMIARFVKDVTLPDATEVAPGARLVKTWRFRNESAKAWPEGTRMLFVGKKCDRLEAPESVEVPACAPGQEVDVSMPLVAPLQGGRYTAYFRLAGPKGKKFGQRVWAMLTVYESSSSSSDEAARPAAAAMEPLLAKYAVPLRALTDMGYTQLRLNVRLLNKFNGNLEKVVECLIKRQQRKAALPAC